MMLTRCPECATVFRVTPEQLKARQGRVRCGRCHRVFNAIDALIENIPAKLDSAPEPEPPTSDAATEQPTPPSVAPNPAQIPTPAETDGTDAWIPRVVEPDHSATVSITEEPSSKAQAADELFIVEPEPGPPSAETIEFEAVLDAGDGDASAAQPAAAAVLGGSGPEHAPSIATELPVTEPLASEHPAAPLPPMEPLLHEPPHTRPAWPWAVAAVAFAALLIGQAALFYRVELAIQYPQLRASFASICDQIDCEMPLPRHIDLISIEASDLNPDTPRKGRLHLSATLKNRADFAQEYPHLELTLTDTQDQALARRALTPKEYLTTAPSPAGFAARAETTVALDIDGSSLPASGYRLYVFYP